MKIVLLYLHDVSLPLICLLHRCVRPQTLAQQLFGLALGTLSITGFAADECDENREVQVAVARKMSKNQQDQIHDLAISLCLKRMRYESNRKTVQNDQTYIDELNSLLVSYCGIDPDSVGRGQRCRQDKAKLEEFINTKFAENVRIMRANEKRIKKQEARLEYSKNAKPFSNSKSDQVLFAKQEAQASIAKVKEDILEALKDPGSAQFRRILVAADGGIVCGEVNAKNAMGGYIGFKKFVNIEDKDQDFTYYEDTANAVNARLQSVCEDLAKK